METAALIGLDGAVEWLCLPRFDSPSVFGSILDQQKGGSFTITPCGGKARYQQLYSPDTNILVTRFLTPEGVVELTDFMPVKVNSRRQRSSWLVRRLKAVSGSASLKLRCAPAFDYGGRGHEVDVNRREAIFRTPDLSLRLSAAVPLQKAGGAAEADITLQESQGVSFILGMAGEKAPGDFLEEAAIDELEEGTAAHWRNWIAKCTYQGRWRELVHRSALLLELLTYAPTGAIIAAPTSSLPEWIGGERNWDYRYNWIRDAAYTVYALLRIGLYDEATRFMGWVEERCAELPDGSSLQTVYAVDGGRNLHEQTLP
jgi:GH15 family glucan-1,4-alpha-glucosidase